MQSVTGGTSVPPNVVIAMAGIAKVYVGEICEEGNTLPDDRQFYSYASIAVLCNYSALQMSNGLKLSSNFCQMISLVMQV